MKIKAIFNPNEVTLTLPTHKARIVLRALDQAAFDQHHHAERAIVAEVAEVLRLALYRDKAVYPNREE